MKKLLILGATINQLPLIKAARDAGIFVVVCDWTTTNPGIPFANKHYQVSTMDLDAVMKVAISERVDGCVTNSEPALMNATLVAERLGLPGNPSEAIDILTSKVGFRDLQERIGLYAPKHYVCNSVDALIDNAKKFCGPFVVKPVRSSGSRGTTVCKVFDEAVVRSAYDECTNYSRDGQCSVEEYVAMPSLQVIDGDVFLCNGKIIWDGLFLSVRSPQAPLVPMTQVYPLRLSDTKMERVRHDISSVLLGSGVKLGQFNIEAYFTDKDDLFIIEINARQGGNRIPSRIFEYSGVDLNRVLVSTAVGDFTYWDYLPSSRRAYKHMSFHQVYSHVAGFLEKIEIDKEIEPYVVRMESVKKIGDPVDKCCNATGIVSFACLEFENAMQQDKYSYCLESYIYPKLSGGGSLNFVLTPMYWQHRRAA